MNEPIENILSDAVDGTPCDSRERIGSLEPSDLIRVASELVVHGLLLEWAGQHENRNEQRIDRVLDEIGGGSNRKFRRKARGNRVSAFKIASSILLLAAAGLVVLWLANPKGDLLAATDSVETMISAALDEVDRTYRVHVVEKYDSAELAADSPEERQFERETVDEATLIVRGLDRFVLMHSPVSGDGRVAGCDGKQSWSFRNDTAVYISSDLEHFRNSLPGEQGELPLLNIQKHLAQLKSGYRLKLLPKSKAGRNGETLSQLTGVKKSKDVSGPKEIEIWFDEAVGSIHWMLLDQLPQGKGEPKSILLELVAESPVSEKFYSFAFHDVLNRQVVSE